MTISYLTSILFLFNIYANLFESDIIGSAVPQIIKVQGYFYIIFLGVLNGEINILSYSKVLGTYYFTTYFLGKLNIESIKLNNPEGKISSSTKLIAF